MEEEVIYQEIIKDLVRGLARARESEVRAAAARDAAREREEDRGADALKIWSIIAPVRESDGAIEMPSGIEEILNRCRWLVGKYHELQRLEAGADID